MLDYYLHVHLLDWGWITHDNSTQSNKIAQTQISFF